MVAVLQWGANKPQPWRDQVARAVWRDLPVLKAAVWSGGAGRHLPGALPWLRGCGDASPPPAELRGAVEHLYSKPRHQFLVAADHGVELSDDVVALAADVVQCLAPHAMMLPRETAQKCAKKPQKLRNVHSTPEPRTGRILGYVAQIRIPRAPSPPATPHFLWFPSLRIAQRST